MYHSIKKFLFISEKFPDMLFGRLVFCLEDEKEIPFSLMSKCSLNFFFPFLLYKNVYI